MIFVYQLTKYETKLRTPTPKNLTIFWGPRISHRAVRCTKFCLLLRIIKVWADPVSLATTSGIIGYFLFFKVLRCFSSPACRYPILWIQIGATGHDSSEVSPFGHLRIKAYLAAPRSLSQLVASFVGIFRQGIHYVRLSNFLRLMTNRFSDLGPGSIGLSSLVQLTSYWYSPWNGYTNSRLSIALSLIYLQPNF